MVGGGGERLPTMGCLLTAGRKCGRTGQEHQQLSFGRPEAGRIDSAPPPPTPGSLELNLLPRVDHHCSTEEFADSLETLVILGDMLYCVDPIV